MEFTPDALLHELNATAGVRPARIWLAFSGGLDSTVLLHALAEQREALAAPLAAVHVDHQLHPDSARWAQHCVAMCARLGVPLERYEVSVDTVPGASIEAAARDARYQVFRSLLEDGEVLLTAQHEDDQLETFMLQALRGAGPHGLAAMPRLARLGAGWQLRPLLMWPRAALAAWAKARGLDWLEDPSNADERFDRNFLRRKVLPVLRTRWPAAAQTISRSARHCAEASALVDELAAIDLAACGDGEQQLNIPALRQLDLARRRNLLRHWLDWLGLPRPSEKKLEHILSDVLEADPGAEPCVRWGEAAVNRYRDRLYAGLELPPPQGGLWQGETFELGKGWGRLRREQQGSGEPGLPGGEVEVRFRLGGERIRPQGRAHHHELKKLFQDAGVLPWRRTGIPLVYVGNALVAVADLWLNADLAVPGGWRVGWQEKPRITAQ